MKIKKLKLLATFLVILFVSACNNKVGCPASQAATKMVNVNDSKQGVYGKKAKKVPKSSVMPREVKIKVRN